MKSSLFRLLLQPQTLNRCLGSKKISSSSMENVSAGNLVAEFGIYYDE